MKVNRSWITAAASFTAGVLATIGVSGLFRGEPGVDDGKLLPPVTLVTDPQSLDRIGGGDLRLSDPRLSLRDLKKIGEQLVLSDPVAAVLRAKEVPGVENRDIYLGEVLRTWGETDGPAAVQWVLSQFAGEHLSDALYYVADGWAETDPEGSAKWFIENTTGAILDDALWEAVEAWGRKDTPAALAWANQLDPYLKWTVMDGLASGWASVDPPAAAAAGLGMLDDDHGHEFVMTAVNHWADADPQAAAGWIRSLTNARLRANSSGELAKVWAMGDPQAAVRWASGIEDERSRTAALHGIADGWSRHDPGGAIDWALSSVNDPDLQDEVVSDITFNWGVTDPTGATSWLERKSPGPDRDLILRKFSNNVFEDDPRAAVGWAAEIGDPAVKEAELRSLLQRWVEIGGDAARAEISGIDLPAGLAGEFGGAPSATPPTGTNPPG